MFRKEEIEKLLSEYDCLTSRLLTLDFSYHYGFSDNHNVRDLDVTGEVIREKYPEDYPLFEKLVHENHTYFGNICVMKKPLFDAYCAWLFDIFAEVRKRIDIDSYDSYHKRVFGFISEFLLYVWVTKHKLRAYECMVGMIGEKAETKEMKQRLADCFAEKRYCGCKAVFYGNVYETTGCFNGSVGHYGRFADLYADNCNRGTGACHNRHKHFGQKLHI